MQYTRIDKCAENGQVEVAVWNILVLALIAQTSLL